MKKPIWNAIAEILRIIAAVIAGMAGGTTATLL